MGKRTENALLKISMQNSGASTSIRKASSEDYAFLSSGIWLAEYGHSGPAPWCALFQLTEKEFKYILFEILENDIPGQEWCADQFYIYQIGDTPVAGISTWIEGAHGSASSLLMSTLMYHFIPEEKRISAESKLQQLSEIRIARTPGYLQLESIFTLPEHRGKGIGTSLIHHILEQEKRKNPELPGTEIQLSADNAAAIHTYQKCGFEITERRIASDRHISEIYPGKGKIKMSKRF
jgi:ribosomal protein S18 acetylase RimI-like enzyme